MMMVGRIVGTCCALLFAAWCMPPLAVAAIVVATPVLTMRVTRGFGLGTALLPVALPKSYLSVSVTMDIPAGSAVAGGLVLRVVLPAGAQMGSSVSPAPGWTCTQPDLGMTGPVVCTSQGVPVPTGRATFAFTTGAACSSCTFEATVSADTPAALPLTTTTATPVDGEPVLRWVEPAVGDVAGGFIATVTGDSFSGAATLTIGATPVQVIAAYGPRLTFVMPPGAPGVVDVRVTTTAGVSLVLPRAFTYVGGPTDADADGLVDEWERRFGLRVEAGTDATQAGRGDPDGDGLNNLAEQADGTHPVGAHATYFAEGAVTNTMDFAAATVTPFFDTSFALLNPGETSATVNMRFLRTDSTVVSFALAIPGHSRRTVNARTDVPSLLLARSLRRPGGPHLVEQYAEFATIVESDQPLVVERTMRWDGTGYGSHAEAGIASPRTTWYLAEGATHSGFDLFYLLQNPGMSAATVEVRYLLPAPAAPVVKSYVVSPQSRFNVWVNTDDARLSGTDVSAHIVADAPIIVERAMYRSNGALFNAGHNSAGVVATAPRWFFAEGATGPYFDLFLLIANPTTAAADVQATYLLPSGDTIVRTYNVAAQSRFNIWVDREDPLLADTAVSTVIEATNGVGIIAERAMWWPGDGSTWHEGHNSPGATETGTTWALAAIDEGGPEEQTYILVANTSAFAGRVKATLMFEDGTTAERTFTVAANSRFNIAVAVEFFPEALHRRSGAVVESVGATPAQIVVERATYSDASGVAWAAGTNALATKLK